MRRAGLFVVVVFAVFAAPRPSFADPVVITGGDAGLYWDGQLTSFSFTGPGTSIVQDGRNPWGPTSFTVGSPVQFSGTLNPESSHGFQMIVNGTTYDNAVLVGGASFMTDSYAAPGGGGSAVDVELPLLLSGHFDAYTFGVIAGAPLFSFDVALGGVFRSSFVNVTDDVFLNRDFAASAEFTPREVPSQTPEPGTILLLGTPLAAAAVRRSRRRLPLVQEVCGRTRTSIER